MAPEDTVTLLSTVPATLNVPPLETVRKAPVPPARTFTVPAAEMRVPEPNVPEINPPDSTFSTPPLETVTLLVMVPATLSVPLDTTTLCAVPPADTFIVPLETVR